MKMRFLENLDEFENFSIEKEDDMMFFKDDDLNICIPITHEEADAICRFVFENLECEE